MRKNNLLARQRAMQNACFEAGVQMGRQQVVDMMCLALNDPDIMGKDTFGRGRLMKLIAGIGQKMDTYHNAFQKTDDADYYQAKLDAALAEAFKEKELKDSFYKRYEYMPEYDYEKGRWKG